MTSWTEAHNYMSEPDDEPPPCPGCADLTRRLESEQEHLSEIVLDVPQADGSPALMRCTPNLPDIVTALVEALKVVDRRGEALIGEQQWYAWGSECPNMMRQVREALKAAGVELFVPWYARKQPEG
jgi:hypothetical protein